jgi:hypothetical protein
MKRIIILVMFCFWALPVYIPSATAADKSKKQVAKDSIDSMSSLDARKELHQLGINFCQKSFFDAIANGDIDVVKLFLKCGMSVNERGAWTKVRLYAGAGQDDVYIQFSALILALMHNRLNIAKMLIEKGADVNMGVDGTSPLLIATTRNQNEIVKMLRERGADFQKHSFKGHYYKVFYYKTDWKDAKRDCESIGGYLAIVNSKEENDYLTKLAQDHFLWLGANNANKDNKWVWVDGMPVTYTNWQEGQPDDFKGIEHYLAICPGGGWNDLPENPAKENLRLLNLNVNGFICEWNDRKSFKNCKINKKYGR